MRVTLHRVRTTSGIARRIIRNAIPIIDSTPQHLDHAHRPLPSYQNSRLRPSPRNLLRSLDRIPESNRLSYRLLPSVRSLPS